MLYLWKSVPTVYTYLAVFLRRFSLCFRACTQQIISVPDTRAHAIHRLIELSSPVLALVTALVPEELPAEPEKKKPVLGKAAAAPAEGEPAAEKAPVNANNAVKAPLPGVITDIKVNVGDAVKKGDVVIVLEAMKMANNLEAESDGTVTAICVKMGENVLEDAPLVVIE